MTPPHQNIRPPKPIRRGRQHTNKRAREVEEIGRLRRMISSLTTPTVPVISTTCPYTNSPPEALSYLSLHFDFDYLQSTAFMRKYPNQTIPGSLLLVLPNTPIGHDFQRSIQEHHVFDHLWPVIQRTSAYFMEEVEKVDIQERSQSPRTQGATPNTTQGASAFQVHTIGKDGHWNRTVDERPVQYNDFKFLTRPQHPVHSPAD